MVSGTSNGRRSQKPETASDTLTPPRPRGAQPTILTSKLAKVFGAYVSELGRPGGPLDADSIRVYGSRVRQYLAWLATADVDGDPFREPAARDWAVRDYRTHLLTVARRKPATVNAHLTAVDDFYRRRGLGPAAAKREDLPNAAPRALSKKAQIRWLRATEQASPRDRAIALAGFYAGLRIAEIVALDLGDLRTSARKGHIVVRCGKGGHYREVPLHPVLHKALDAWLAVRSHQPGAAGPALFLNRRGNRLSTRGAYNTLIAIAETAGIDVGRDAEFTPHVLRHTAGTTMTRAGTDIILVAEILGHSVETARRYALPTNEDRHAAIGRLTTDE
jgi:site-specific recombinase XerD